MKELNLEEVLRIAGRLPVTAALDELTYRAPQESAGDPVEHARLLVAGLRESEPFDPCRRGPRSGRPPSSPSPLGKGRGEGIA